MALFPSIFNLFLSLSKLTIALAIEYLSLLLTKTPLFLFKNLKIKAIRSLSEGKHLKLTLKDDNYMVDAIGFNIGNLVEEFLIDDKVDIVGTLDINSFNGMESVQIVLKDIRKSF